MKKNAQRTRPRSDRYIAASIAQYLHELSGRHADEREHARDGHVAAVAAPAVAPALAGR